MARPQVADGGTASECEGYLRIYRISCRRCPTRGGPPAWGLGEMVTFLHPKNVRCYETFHATSEFMADDCECGNEPSGTIQCGELLDWLRNC
jgi:hypothetical protein